MVGREQRGWIKARDEFLGRAGGSLVLRGNLEKTKRTRLEGQLERQREFLRLFGKLGTVGEAARGAGMNRQSHYDWLREDAQGYRAKWEAAQAEWREGLEARAMARIDDPQGNRGSDVLLLAMLNAAWPDKYRPGVVVVDDTAKDLLAHLRKRAVKGRGSRKEAEASE